MGTGTDLTARFAALIGKPHVLTDASDTDPYTEEWRGRWNGKAAAVLRPGSTAEVAAIVKLAAATGTALVPQGGNTGLVGGQIPDGSGAQMIVSLQRMNRVRHVDAAGYAMIAEAGVTLQAVQDAAADVDRLFPLSLAAEGSATIGGNLATNAGGTGVLAYGTARELCLGLEVVLPNGEVWDGLNTLRKNNTGYDLKNLFIGAEGTLGIITAAALKLFPRSRAQVTIFAGVASPADALSALGMMRDTAPGTVTTFELMPQAGLDLVLRHIPGTRTPLPSASPWYVLAEVSTQHEDGFGAAVDSALEKLISAGACTDLVTAQSNQQARDFWKLRESMSEAQKHEGASIKHDVSLPVASVPAFLEEGVARVLKLVPDARPVPFGHLGDGNIHFNFSQPKGGDGTAFLARLDEINHAVHSLVHDMGGSISAEHGIGVAKRDLLRQVKSETEMKLMHQVKAMLDPMGIMNPGKVL